MAIEVLDQNVIALIRSSMKMDSVTQCVTELMLNSLDAKSTAIAIRVNLSTFRIQIVDNGRGISRTNLEVVGVRYMSSKCHSLTDLKRRLKSFGFRGEALASICRVSQRVIITSREANSSETYCKTIEGDTVGVEVAKWRPSCGTTVTVEGFLSNLPVRQQCMKSNELETTKKALETILLVHPKVSFTLRNDAVGKIIFDRQQCADVISSFKTIHPAVDETNFTVLKIVKDKTSVEGLIQKELYENKKLQYIYVNKRPVVYSKIQNLIDTCFKRERGLYSNPKNKYPIYLIHIKCPYSEVDFDLQPGKSAVLFKKFEIVRRCIEKMIRTLLGQEKIAQAPIKDREPARNDFGLSQIMGAVKGFGVKRKSEQFEEVPRKSQRIEQISFDLSDDIANFVCENRINKPLAALPIEIKKRGKKFDDVDRIVEPEEVPNNNQMENTFFTNFPENERRGKDVIMDMFIKSVQVFPKDDAKSVVLTVDKSVERPINSSEKVSMGVQADLEETGERQHEESCVGKQGMVSIGIQATPEAPLIQNHRPNFNNLPNKKQSTLKRHISDSSYCIRTETPPILDFGPKFQNLGHEVVPSIFIDETTKLFDFRKKPISQFDPFKNKIAENTFFQPDSNKFNATSLENVKLSPIPKLSLQRRPPEFRRVLSQEPHKSPYFSTHRRYDFEGGIGGMPLDGNNERKKLWRNFLNDNNINNLEMTTSRRRRPKNNLNETISSFFQPNNKKSSSPKFFQEQFFGESRKQVEDDIEQSGDLFPTNKSDHEESNIVITINDSDKEEIINRDVEFEKNIYKKNCLITQTLTNEKRIEDKNNTENLLVDTLTQLKTHQSNWIKEVNDFGKPIYINRVTGMRSIHSPKSDVSFNVMKRFDFIPKGQSPVLLDTGNVEELNPESRQHLQNAIIQSFDDELLVVKWANYIINKDSKQFFNEMYLEKSKLIENPIPNACKSKNVGRFFEGMSFTKELFISLEIIGQIDCKFIAVLVKDQNLLLLFDQHAVHERVRLEMLLEAYRNVSKPLDENVVVPLTRNDVSLMDNQKSILNLMGLMFKYNQSGLLVFGVPLCLYNKSRKGADLASLIEMLVKEIVETLKSNNGIIVNTPKCIQNIMNSEACRGAIKFGDKLNKNDCIMHLRNLSECKLPFQCAHGRPTLTPLISLDKNQNKFENFTKPNLRKLVI